MSNFSTRAVHAGLAPEPANRPASLPIYQSAGWVFRDLDEVDAIYEGRTAGAIYGTDGVPNILALEALVAELEGAETALATSGGMAAFFATFMGLLGSGDRVVASRDLYGNTTRLLADLSRFGVVAEFVDATDLDAVQRALQSKTRLVVVETISNPRLRVADLRELAKLAHDGGALLLVDNTFASPYHCLPLAHGADLVVESATKFFGGHHDLVLGALAGRAEVVDRIRTLAVRASMVPGAFDAWLAARSIQTLGTRLERASSNALALATWLSQQKAVGAVHYPGLPSHPDRRAAQALLTNGAGAMLAFEIAGGRAGVNALVRGLSMIRLVLSLGGTATTLSHPATSSHRALSREQRDALGIHDGFLRMSVGIEDIADIESDLERGFAALAT